MNESDVAQSPPTKKQRIDPSSRDQDSPEVDSEKENQLPVVTIELDDDQPAENTKLAKSPLRRTRRTKAEVEKEKKEKEERKRKREEDLATKKAEKEKEKEEKKKAKEAAELEKAEKRRQEQEEKQRKHEEREKKKNEKEEREKQLRDEKEQKQKEKDEIRKKKEVEERLKIEEKEKAEQEKHEREEKARQQRAKFFQNFSKKRVSTKIEPVEFVSRWSRFMPQRNQYLPPVNYRKLSPDDLNAFETNLKTFQPDASFLQDLKSRPRRTRGKIIRPKERDEECLLINPDLDKALKEGARFKYFNFHTDSRPAYFGTHRKKSITVKPRVPLAKDSHLDYEYNSGEDWEEEPEDAEKLSGDEKISDDEETDDEEKDGFFVPHGYLSDEEQADDGDDQSELFQAAKKKNQKQKQARFDKMRRQKLRRLVVNIEGPLFDDRFDWEETVKLVEGPINPLKDYSEIAQRKARQKKEREVKKQQEKEKKIKQKQQEKEEKEEKIKQKQQEKEQKKQQEKEFSEGELPEGPSTPKGRAPKTPKTPKSAGSMLKFVSATKSKDQLRKSLFTDSEKARQRQAENKEKAKDISKEKPKEDEKPAPATNGTQPKINILTPKRKKKKEQKENPKPTNQKPLIAKTNGQKSQVPTETIILE